MSQKQCAKPSHSLGTCWLHIHHTCINIPHICCVFSRRPLRCPQPTATLCTSVLYNINTKQMVSAATRHRADILSLLFLIHSHIERPVAPVQLPPSSRKLFQLCMTHSITWPHMGLIFLLMCLLRTLYMFVKTAWLFWHARGRGDLTCTVTPAAPYVLHVGKLHSARLSSRVARHPFAHKQRGGIDGPEATQPMFFLKKLNPPPASVFSTAPSSPLSS